jgi:hypothetical protein
MSVMMRHEFVSGISLLAAVVCAGTHHIRLGAAPSPCYSADRRHRPIADRRLLVRAAGDAGGRSH